MQHLQGLVLIPSELDISFGSAINASFFFTLVFLKIDLGPSDSIYGFQRDSYRRVFYESSSAQCDIVLEGYAQCSLRLEASSQLTCGTYGSLSCDYMLIYQRAFC